MRSRQCHCPCIIKHNKEVDCGVATLDDVALLY